MHLLFEKAFDVGSELTQLHICHAKRHHNLRWQTQTTERSRVQELEFKRERDIVSVRVCRYAGDIRAIRHTQTQTHRHTDTDTDTQTHTDTDTQTHTHTMCYSLQACVFALLHPKGFAAAAAAVLAGVGAVGAV